MVAAAKGTGVEVNGTAIETGDIFAKNGEDSLLMFRGQL